MTAKRRVEFHFISIFPNFYHQILITFSHSLFHPLFWTAVLSVYTWTPSDGQYRNHIDYILCSQRWRSSIQSAKQEQELTVAQTMTALLPNSDLNSEKVMAPHSSTLAWKIPWTEEPGRLQSLGSLRVGHNWATSLSLFTFHFHALEKEMATHSTVLAWRIPGMVEPGGLPSMGSHRVRHDWRDLAAAAVADLNWRK